MKNWAKLEGLRQRKEGRLRRKILLKEVIED